MAYYAAYGSNLDPEQMRRRCPHSPLIGTGWLTGWRLTFGGEDVGWDGALATVVEQDGTDAQDGSDVFVAVYDLMPADERELDRWEQADTGLYRKITVRVTTLFGDTTAHVYVLDRWEGGLPSTRYLGLMAEAAERGGAPTEYVTRLRSRESRAAS